MPNPVSNLASVDRSNGLLGLMLFHRDTCTVLSSVSLKITSAFMVCVL
jgi:hypothetical protein